MKKGAVMRKMATALALMTLCVPHQVFAKPDLKRTLCEFSAGVAAEAMRSRQQGVPEEEFISGMINGHLKDYPSEAVKIAIG